MSVAALCGVALVAATSAAAPRRVLPPAPQNAEIYAFNLTTKVRQNLTRSTESDYGATVSPSGRMVAFVRGSSETDVWLMRIDGKKQHDLTSTKGQNEFDPSWSPDGRLLAYSIVTCKADVGDPCGTRVWALEIRDVKTSAVVQSFPDARHGRWAPDGRSFTFEQRIGLDGSAHEIGIGTVAGHRERLALGSHPVWAPRGGSIAFYHGKDLSVISSQGTKARLLARTGGNPSRSDPSWDPSASRIAFRSLRLTRNRYSDAIYSVRTNGTKRRQLTPRGIYPEGPVWQRRGRKIAFVATAGRGSQGRQGRLLSVVDASTNRVQSLMAITPPSGTGPDAPAWTPDGKRVLIASVLH